MGYYCSFDLEVYKGFDTSKPLEEDVVYQLREEISDFSGMGVIDLFEGDEWKWYEEEETMKEFSKKYPDYLFQVTWVGEDDERGRNLYKDGKHHYANVKIIYDDFDPARLK